MPKENKTDSIKIRISPDDKQKIFNYCAEMGIQVSDFIRFTVLNKIKESENK